MHGTWLHNFDNDTWRNLKSNGGGKPFKNASHGARTIGYYDPQRKLIIVQRHHDTHHFDVREERVEEGADRRQGRRPFAVQATTPAR